MARWRRPGAGEMLKVFLLLSVVAFILGLVWQPAVPRNDVVSFPVVVFFVWRVSRGGRISRIILIVASGVSYVAAVLAVARSWDLLIVALAIIYAAQIALWSARRSTAVPGPRRFSCGQRAGPSSCGVLRLGFCPGGCSLAWS